ncbi:MAG: hypothetical protein KIT09_01750 [Bryobacteraceae bacterium]|nr:hypothetical protein [Bryobacteraceae bacterium]
MKLKSYFAETVEQAVSRAKQELGPEAMLVYSREAHAEARYLGSYEVVFAPPEGGRIEASRLPAPPPAPPAPTPWTRTESGPPQPPATGARSMEEPSVERLSLELAVLRRQMERMMAAFARGNGLAPESSRRPGLIAALDPLSRAGVSNEIVEQLAGRLSAAAGALTPLGDLDQAGMLALRREMGAMFSVDSSLGVADAGPRYVALAGPPGAGKTTTLVKLAVAYGLKCRKPAQLISMDTWRIGGADQLRSYAAILGVGFLALETAGALAQALEEHRHKDLVLIDTPGLSENDMDAAEDLAAFLRSRSDIDTHLTLTASMNSADLRRAVDRYERFNPSKLLFTKVDETSLPGTIFSEAVRTSKPVSFLTSGQRIPEDLQEAAKDGVLDLILGCPTSGSEAQDLDAALADPFEPGRQRERQAAAA